MKHLIALALLVGCTDGNTDDTSTADTGAADTGASDTGDADTGPVECVETATRTYDTAADPSLSETVDPALDFSADDLSAAVLGSYSGTYTPADASAAFTFEVAMSIDGEITVTEYSNCDNTWSAPLVYAMSSEQVEGAYQIDDLWSPVLTTTASTGGSFEGSKDASEFDGTLDVSGEVGVSCAHGGSTDEWTCSLTSAGAAHGSFTLAR